MARFRSLRTVPALVLLLLALFLVTAVRRIPPHREASRPPTEQPPQRPPEVLAGPVKYVFDGDTLELQGAEGRWRIRLEGIDAPERLQPYGSAARDYLVQLCDQRASSGARGGTRSVPADTG